MHSSLRTHARTLLQAALLAAGLSGAGGASAALYHYVDWTAAITVDTPLVAVAEDDGVV